MMDALILPWSDGSFLQLLRWWAVLLMLSAIGWRALRTACAGWLDLGWPIARPLMLVACAYPLWSMAHWIPMNGTAGAWGSTLAVAAAVLAWTRLRARAEPSARSLQTPALRHDWPTLFAAELRFVLPFLFYLAMRGFNRDLIGLEKFMDFGFVNAAYLSSMMPPFDPWFAGEPINYYYFGHYLTAFLCHLSGVPPAAGYNLMLATLFALCWQLAFAVVAELARALPERLRGTMAAVAALWLTLGGNVHGFLYGFVKPWLVDFGWVEAPRQAFLLSDPTRFVGFDPPTGDKLIHEFPAYAFYVGDLHAHLLNLPLVLSFVALVLGWLRSGARGWLAGAAALVGTFAMSNAWDALMYAALLGSLLLARFGAALYRRDAAAIRARLADGIGAALLSAIVVAPFLLRFRSFAAGFGFTHSHTPVWQWLILYGLQALLALAACVLIWRAARIAPPGIARSAEHRMLIVLTGFGLAFALLPEFIYVKDIYGPEHYRSNTAFKFGFQAFTLLTLAACAGIAMLIARAGARTGRRLPRLATIVLLELTLVPPLYYGWFVLQGGFGGWREREWTLDGQRFLALSHPQDMAAIRWLAQQARDDRPLIEAVGDSYTFAGRISINAGVAAVLGWPVHELLWRGSGDRVWPRRDDVAALYETRDAADARRIIDRYGARWLVIGRYERERYPKLDAALLASLGRIAYRSDDTLIIDLDEPAAASR